jgi:CheY-like chemotaxis protein
MSDLPLGRGQTVLVVEDSEMTRASLVDSLEMLRYTPLAASNGREALELYVKHGTSISLVLSDLVMPDMGGRALVDALQRGGASMPIIMLSGHGIEAVDEDLRGLGVNGWLRKPVDLAELARLLDEVL